MTLVVSGKDGNIGFDEYQYLDFMDISEIYR